MLNWVEHEKSFITLGPVLFVNMVEKSEVVSMYLNCKYNQ